MKTPAPTCAAPAQRRKKQAPNRSRTLTSARRLW